MTYDPKMLDKIAVALILCPSIYDSDSIYDSECDSESDSGSVLDYNAMALAALRALPISPEALNALWVGTAEVVLKDKRVRII